VGRVPPPPAEAFALSAFRALPSGVGRQYSATTFPQNPWQGCEHMIRTVAHLGMIRESTADDDGYAVLDVLNKDGDIIADYSIRDSRAFQYLKRKLHWVVESQDGVH
jgi:hypothetical protein